MSPTIILVELGSVVLLAAAVLGLGRMYLRPATQRVDRKMAVSRSAENASRLLVATLGLSMMIALFAVIRHFVP